MAGCLRFPFLQRMAVSSLARFSGLRSMDILLVRWVTRASCPCFFRTWAGCPCYSNHTGRMPVLLRNTGESPVPLEPFMPRKPCHANPSCGKPALENQGHFENFNHTWFAPLFLILKISEKNPCNLFTSCFHLKFSHWKTKAISANFFPPATP